MNLQSIKETIELNLEDITGNRELTNEIVIDDIMLSMGYNKKRVRGVKRVYNSDIDWEIIINEEHRFIVRTIGYGEELKINSEDIINNHRGFDFLVITDGNYIELYSEKLDTKEPIIKTKLEDEEDFSSILEKLGLNGYSYKSIEELFSTQLLTIEELNNVIDNNIDKITNFIVGLTGFTENERNTKIVQKRLCDRQEDSQDKSNYDMINTIKIIQEENNILKEENEKIIEEINRLKEENNTSTIEDKGNTEEIDKLNEEIQKLKEENNVLKQQNVEIFEENNRLKEEINIKQDSSRNTEDNCGNTQEKINKFISEIEKLNNDKAELKSTITKLEDTIYNLKNSKEAKQEETEIAAKQLLDTIEDNPESPRAYVAVIGTKLFQKEDLHEFIGTAIEELYNIVGFDLLPALFDGDSFVLIQNPEKSDFTLNKKQYAIDFEDLTEEDILAKIVGLFSNFKEVKIYCKTIGTIQEDISRKKVNLVVPINELKTVVFDNNTEVHRILSVGNNNKIQYVIPDIANEDQSIALSKTIDSLIAMTTNTNEAVKVLKKKELSKISRHLEIISQSNKKNPKIAFTKYVINGIDNIEKCVPIINEICNIINTDKDNTILVIEATSTNNEILEKYERNIETIDVYKQEIIQGDNLREIKLSGNIVDSITFTKRSLKVQSDIIKVIKGIRYNQKENKIESVEDILNTVIDIIENRTDCEIEFKPEIIGKVLGEDCSVISTDISEVSVDNREIQVSDTTYYISDMESWQYIYFIIKLYAVCNKSRDIEFTVEIDESSYNIYLDNRIDLDPSLGLSVKTFIDYIKVKMC